MKWNAKTLLSLALLALCMAASAQTTKLIPVKDRESRKYGYQDKQKNWVIPPSFDDANRFDNDGLALVKVDGFRGLINESGEFVLPALYDDIGKFDKNGLCELTIKQGRQKLYGVANQSGTVVLPVAFRSVTLPKKGGYIAASHDTDPLGNPLWGLYTADGREVFAPQFQSAPTYYDGVFIAKDGHTGLEGVVDLDGHTLLPFEYLTVSHFNNGYRTLGSNFVQTTYSRDFRQAGYFRQPGSVLPYDPMGDPVRAAAWHCGPIGVRLHANQVRAMELQQGRLTRSATCRPLGIDWGYGRFLRLEPFETDAADPDAMADGLSGKSYTLKALLYEADGSLVGTVSESGWLEAECSAGVLYNAEGKDTWLILSDPNSLALSSYTMSLSGYRALDHDNIYNGLGIRANDLDRLGTARHMADRCIAIIEGDNVGITSYLPPVVDIKNARREREVMRGQLFHHDFHMGEVVSCTARSKKDLLEVDLYEQLVCRFEDRLQDPYYSMNGEEVIFWGPHNNRTVRVSLEAISDRAALEDDLSDSKRNWCIVLSLYEEDGSWLRTLARVPFADYAQDGIMVFKDAGIALLSPTARKGHRENYGWSTHSDPRGAITHTLKLEGAQPLPHTVSALEAFSLRGNSGRR